MRRTLSAEEAIVALRAKIDRLGPVNMMAIEQFDELETRHTFLSTQRKDLVDSIAQTSEAIKRIDETTRQRFAEAFTAINRNFQETFSTLFGGGRAGLTLLDETDPLESGIEIIAQPPGKRLQSVQLLSGGEKALTAIALMFGLFKYKPSPFCLLDEIDAPLDDANIGRFVEMLRGDAAAHAVHPHHAQPQDDGDRRPPLRRHDGGARRVEADFGSAQLNVFGRSAYVPAEGVHDASHDGVRRKSRRRRLSLAGRPAHRACQRRVGPELRAAPRRRNPGERQQRHDRSRRLRREDRRGSRRANRPSRQ